MKKAMVIREKQKTKFYIIGGLMIGFAVIDFAMSFMGINLRHF